jgi:hypothetical protein
MLNSCAETIVCFEAKMRLIKLINIDQTSLKTIFIIKGHLLFTRLPVVLPRSSYELAKKIRRDPRLKLWVYLEATIGKPVRAFARMPTHAMRLHYGAHRLGTGHPL